MEQPHKRIKHFICNLLDRQIRSTPQCEHLAGTCTSLRQRWAQVEDKLRTESDESQAIILRLQSDLDSTTAALVAERTRKKKRPVRK